MYPSRERMVTNQLGLPTGRPIVASAGAERSGIA